MFTGLIREIGAVRGVRYLPEGLRFSVEAPSLSISDLEVGSSIAVDGVCQTVTELSVRAFTAEAVHSTLEKTTLRYLRPGRLVNLEPALRMGDPLDGHLMQGHVTCRTTLEAIRNNGIARDLVFSLNEKLRGGIVPEGSVAVDGISLTVSALGSGCFTITIIPETWENTVLSRRRPGDEVNIEIDRVSAARIRSAVTLDENTMQEWGYQ